MTDLAQNEDESYTDAGDDDEASAVNPKKKYLKFMSLTLKISLLLLLTVGIVFSITALTIYGGMLLFPTAGSIAMIITAQVGIAVGYLIAHILCKMFLSFSLYSYDLSTPKRFVIALATAVVGVGYGALFGFIIGTFLFPFIGSVVGAAVGAFVGATAAFFVAGFLNIIENESKFGIMLSLGGAVGLGTIAGAIAGNFLFPGLGSLIGAGIGAAVVVSASAVVAV